VEVATIQSDRDHLTALFLQLKQMQQVAGVAEPNAVMNHQSDNISNDDWDNLAFDPVLTNVDSSSMSVDESPAPSHEVQITIQPFGPASIEDQIITLPSNGNSNAIYKNLEISHRVSSAEEQLNHIRNLIAEKSFQFSHVIRVSPRKGVTTRSRAAVKKLNTQIAEHCRFYAHSRSSLSILGAEPSIMNRFKILKPIDVQASTAVLNPNQPGSTSLKLSWIWQTSARNLSLLEESEINVAEQNITVIECMSFPFISIYYFSFFKFGECIGYAPEPKNCDGKKRLPLHRMKCSGLCDILFT
jgi:hypothetical protein